MLRRLLIGFCLLGALVLPLRPLLAAPAAYDFEAIDAYIEAELKAAGLPGLALAIVQGEQIIYSRGYGRAHPDMTPVTPDTPMLIGSVTKSFTALAVMQLVEAGKLELDTPVQRYLPEFQLADPTAAAQITVRQLLSHTSGIATKDGQLMLTGDGISTLDQRVAAFAFITPTAPPGERFQYSNVNYAILGLLVERISEQPYDQYIRQRILAPLAMNQSALTEEGGRLLGMARGHQVWFGMPVPTKQRYTPDAVPAGFLIASANDMGRYAIAQLNGGRYAGGTILSEAGMAELHRPVSPGFGEQEYALGWMVGPVAGRPAVWHGGDNTDFHTDLVLFPEEQLGVIMISNANHPLFTSTALTMLRDGVIRLLHSEKPIKAGRVHRGAYLLFDGLLVGAVLWQVRALVRLRAWRGWASGAGRRRGAGQVLVGLLGGAGLLWLPAGPLNTPWSVILQFAPDVGWGLLLLSGLILAVAVVRGFVWVSSSRQAAWTTSLLLATALLLVTGCGTGSPVPEPPAVGHQLPGFSFAHPTGWADVKQDFQGCSGIVQELVSGKTIRLSCAEIPEEQVEPWVRSELDRRLSATECRQVLIEPLEVTKQGSVTTYRYAHQSDCGDFSGTLFTAALYDGRLRVELQGTGGVTPEEFEAVLDSFTFDSAK